jgi:uracil-DNA glycosylase family 4
MDEAIGSGVRAGMNARAKPDNCIGCACYAHGTDFSAIEGTGSSGVMLVGEASGEHEQRDQLPFRPFAPAGAVLTRVLRRMGLDREQFSITNVLRCRPRNNWLEYAPWEYSALNHCRPNLDAAIAERRPRCIVALGGVALRELTGMAGAQQGISHLAGYVLPLVVSRVPCNECISHDSLLEVPPKQRMTDATCDKCHGTGYVKGAGIVPVIGDFHPAYLRRGKVSHQGVFARILQRALNISKGIDRNWLWNVDSKERSTHGEIEYQTHPSLDLAREFRNRVRSERSLVLSYDIETVESTSLDEDAREGFQDTNIRLVQFSVEPGKAIALPWEPGFREISQELLLSPNVKCGHNVWLFDNKVLRAAGEREGLDLNPRGTIHDTLQMFHHWQPDLPAHLQFAASFVQFPFPWKHLAVSDLEFYGCCDVDATLRLYTMLEKTLKRDQLWGDHQTGYIGQVLEVRPVLAAMEDRGVPIDDTARLELDAEFERTQAKLGAEIASLAPRECCRVHPKSVGYVGVPPQVKAMLAEGLHPEHVLPEYEEIPDRRFQDTGDDPEWYHYEQREFLVADDNLKLVPTLRWCRVYDFNSNSSPQVIAYMKAKGHHVPKSKEEDDEGNQKDTTGEKELRRLANRTGDTFYLKVIEYRGYTKMRGTYIEGFKPGPDGCVHPTFGFGTSMGQLTSKNPDSQNFPKLKPTPFMSLPLGSWPKTPCGCVSRVLTCTRSLLATF